MAKYLSFICFSFLLGTLSAQNLKKEFELDLPKLKVKNSLYNSIEFIDSRKDTSNFGVVQVGLFNRKAKIIAQKQFLLQLQSVMNTITDSTAREGKLLLQLRQFSFAEFTTAYSEKGYLNFRAKLYKHSDTQYEEVASIDTAITIRSLDVTEELLKTGGTALTGFIAKSLTAKALNGSVYSLNDIKNIDNIEKGKLAVYNTDTLIDGLYYTYSSFKTQMPDKKEIFVEIDKEDGTISSLKVLNAKGKKNKVKASEFYAVIYNGIIYISTDYGFYPVIKRSSDFYFTGTIKVAPNQGDLMVASVLFGMIGGLAASNATAVYEVKIDHVNGGFIPLKEIVTNTKPW